MSLLEIALGGLLTTQNIMLALGAFVLYIVYIWYAVGKIKEVVTERRDLTDANGKVIGSTTIRYTRNRSTAAAKEKKESRKEAIERMQEVGAQRQGRGYRNKESAVGDDRAEWKELGDYSKVERTERGDADDFYSGRTKNRYGRRREKYDSEYF